MTDSEKLARWQGPMFGEPLHEYYELPDYLNDDAAAMSLLDTLVEKGFQPVLNYEAYVVGKWSCRIWQEKPDAGWSHAPTRREAIIAACLEVARKELEG